MVRRILSVLALPLLLAVCSAAQTTTTYPVTVNNSGVWGGFLRAFGVQTSGPYINWVQQSSSNACPSQQPPFAGFIYLTLPGQAELPCIPLDGGSTANHGTFSGVDTNGVPFSGSYTFDITTVYRCSGGRGGGCHTVFTIHADGVSNVTITQ